jgi:hypothetical protein
MGACRRVDVRDPSQYPVMRHGRLGTINWADRLAILTLDACHVQTDRAWIYPEYRRSTHRSDDGGDIPRACGGHCMRDLHMHMYRYDRAEVVLILFKSIRFQSYAVQSQIQTVNKRGNVSCRSSFQLNQRVLLLHFGIRT